MFSSSSVISTSLEPTYMAREWTPEVRAEKGSTMVDEEEPALVTFRKVRKPTWEVIWGLREWGGAKIISSEEHSYEMNDSNINYAVALLQSPLPRPPSSPHLVSLVGRVELKNRKILRRRPERRYPLPSVDVERPYRLPVYTSYSGEEVTVRRTNVVVAEDETIQGIKEGGVRFKSCGGGGGDGRGEGWEGVFGPCVVDYGCTEEEE